MRKISAYARKARARNATYNGAEWLNTLTKCRPYTDELLPGAIVQEPSFAAVRRAIIKVRYGFEKLKIGEATHEHFDAVAHATGVAKIRAAQIGGNENPAITLLDTADAALERARERFNRLGKWGFDGPALVQIEDALNFYEDIATSSSPAQMHEAMLERNRILIEQRQAA